MTEWGGMGKAGHIIRRREQLLAALYDSPEPMTTKALASVVKTHYAAVYHDLRRLCGSDRMQYADMHGDVCAPGFPVVWHSWTATVNGGGALVQWSLADAYRDEVAALQREFNELMKGMNDA